MGRSTHTHTHTHHTHTDLLLSSFASDAPALQAAIEHLVAANHVIRVGSTLQLRDRCVCVCVGTL